MITKRTFLEQCATIGLSLIPAMAALPARAADYPDRPVKIIVAQAAGGSLDVILRLVAEPLGRAWRQQVVVLNMPAGGTGIIAARAAASAEPDGYTLFMAGASIFTVLPQTKAGQSFDVSELTPIGLTSEQPVGIVVSPALGVSTLQELIALSKSTPGGLNCAVGARNSLTHLTAEMFRLRSGANLTFVNYPGTAQSLNDVIGGQVPILVQILAGMVGAIADNQVKLLSLTSPSRLASYPNVPTASEAVSDFSAIGWTALVAPRKTPVAIIGKINSDLLAVQAQPEFKDKLDKLGAYTRPMSPPEVAHYIRKEQEFWRPLVHEAGVKPQ